MRCWWATTERFARKERVRMTGTFKTAEEIKALQIAAGTYKPLPTHPTPDPRPPLTCAEATDLYRQRMESRLRRYSSVSLAQRLVLKQRAVAHMGGCCR